MPLGKRRNPVHKQTAAVLALLLLVVAVITGLFLAADLLRLGEPPTVGVLEKAYYLAQVLIVVTALVTAILLVREGRRFTSGLELQVFDTTAARIHEYGQELQENVELLRKLGPASDSVSGTVGLDAHQLFAEQILDFFQTDLFRRAYFPDYTSRFPAFTDWALQTFRELPGLREVAVARRHNYSYGLLSLVERAAQEEDSVQHRDATQAARKGPEDGRPYLTLAGPEPKNSWTWQVPLLKSIPRYQALGWGCLQGDRVVVAAPDGTTYRFVVMSPVLEDRTPDWETPTYRVRLESRHKAPARQAAVNDGTCAGGSPDDCREQGAGRDN